MWPFPKTKWVVVSKEVQPSALELLIKSGLSSLRGYDQDMDKRSVVVHYRDEISGNERVEILSL